MCFERAVHMVDVRQQSSHKRRKLSRVTAVPLFLWYIFHPRHKLEVSD